MEQNQPSVKTFDHEKFGQVRVLGDGDNIRFCLSDVCKILELGNPSQVKSRLDKGVISNETLQTAGGMQTLVFINEDGLYDVILDSRKPAARKFRKWITSEVIPSIRKNGVYMTLEAAEKILYNPDFIIKLAQRVKDLSAQVQLLQPKADYCEKILQSEGTLPVTLIAKDYGCSAKAFNQILAKYKIQHRVGNAWVINEPYSKMNYTKSVTFCPREGYARIQTQWTQKGRMFLYNTLKKCAILPVCERREPMEQLL